MGLGCWRMQSSSLTQAFLTSRHQCRLWLCRCPKHELLRVLLESLQHQSDKLTNSFQHKTSNLGGTKKGIQKTESNGSVHAAPTNGYVRLSNGHSGPGKGNAELTNGHADHENGAKPTHLSHQVCSG